MKKLKIDILFSSRRLIAISAVFLLLAGLNFLAEGLVNTQNIRAQVMQLVKDKTGKDLTIKGKISVSMLPQPTVFLPSIELHDENSESPAPSFSADMVKINLAPFSIFSSQPQISGISVESPSLEFERGHDGIVHWDWLTAGLLNISANGNDSGGDNSLSVSVSDGKILYHNDISDRVIALDAINLSGKLGASLSLESTFESYGHALHMSLVKSGAPAADGVPVTFKLYGDAKNMLQWQGSLNVAGETPALKGKLSIDSNNLLPWLHGESATRQEMFAAITNEAQEKVLDTTVYPVKLSADWDQTGLDVSLANIALQGLNSNASGKLALTWKDAMPLIDSGIDFTALDYNQWRALVNKVTDFYKAANPQPVGYHSNDEPQENPLPKEVQVSMNLSAQQIFIGSQTWQHGQALIKLADAALTVDQFNVELPGDATLSLFGVVTEGTGAGAKGLRFEGSMETRGKSLRQMLTVFDESAKELPDTGFGEFYARSNIFVSPEQVRLSEADVQISELHLNGGLVAYFDTNPRIEADVKLKDINFDYFRDVWRKSQKDAASEKQDFFLKFNKNQNFNWLKKLQTTIDFRVNVDRFTFLDRRGNQANFRLFARENEFGIYDIHMAYPGVPTAEEIALSAKTGLPMIVPPVMTEANVKLDVSSGQPSFNVLLNTSELNTDYFSVNPDPKKPEPVSLEQPAAPAPAIKPADAKPDAKPDIKAGQKVDIVPQAAQFIQLAQDATQSSTPKPAQTIEDLPQPMDSKKPAPDSKPAPGDQAGDNKRWSTDLIDMSWMEGINGNFDISLGRLTHNDITLDSFKLRARLDGNSLNIQALSFLYWQGKCDIVGSVYGGTVPGMGLSFTLYDNDLHDILKSLVGWNNITGRVSVSGTVTTSGVNYLSWLSQADAKLVVAGRGVNVDGFNLPGAVNAVEVSRTAADVLTNVNLALVNGSTEFNVDGNLNVKNGIIRTPGITLKTADITGNLTGEVNLVPWTMDLSALFQFPNMTSETVPTMAMQLSGPVQHAQLQTDTASLEAYVAKRIVGH